MQAWSLQKKEKDDSCWGQACLTSTENTHGYPERRTYTVPLIQLAGCCAKSHQQVSLKATDSVVGHQSISSFSPTERIWGSWEKQCLKWYLCATAFFTVLSWLELHNKNKNTGTRPVPPPWSRLLNMWTTTAASIWSVDVTNSGCNCLCPLIRKHHIFLNEYQTKSRVISTCWITEDHVSITQPLLVAAHLRSSVKDKGRGKWNDSEGLI